MKRASNFILLLFILTIFGCKTVGTYRMTFDPSIGDEIIQAAWISYSVPIRDDMVKYYKKNPNGDYTIPYNVEIAARNNLIDFYLRSQKNYEIYDTYIEDLIKIRAFSKLNEYVFFSFNPGNWTNEKNFNKNSYTEWMDNNVPNHTPLTLVHVEKID